MKWLLAIARAIDRMNMTFGAVAAAAVFAACMVSAGNATVRYLANSSSNAWLEIQWYLFGACVMLGASDVLRLNEHVRVDVLYGRLSGRAKAWVDLLGMLVPWFLDAYRTHEMSGNAGGLVRWPVKLLLPLGFGLLALQGLSEIVKRVGFLAGVHRMDTQYERPLQ